ncbi:hypothetical protein H0G86_012000 [Trichoderma simmonsii]|uniref:Uncharacterized protein n=1 Tax=Trichoderma simmonsii TaxID=1491479 RepID=A0A8G0LPJ4_9HYPO|nr:hypothetical protein H0G86_012000 [Trichoderma simmonsii]
MSFCAFFTAITTLPKFKFSFPYYSAAALDHKLLVNNRASPCVTGLRENEPRFIKAGFDNMTQKPSDEWA